MSELCERWKRRSEVYKGSIPLETRLCVVGIVQVWRGAGGRSSPRLFHVDSQPTCITTYLSVPKHVYMHS